MTDARFVDGHYEEAGPQAPWREASAAIHERLRPLLEDLGVDARATISRTVDATRALAHSRLRAATQLGPADGPGKRLAITISDEVPPPIQPVLERLPSELLWGHVPPHPGARPGGRRAPAERPRPARRRLRRCAPPSRATLKGTTDFLTRLTELALDRTDRVITTIMGAPADVLGAYYFRHARIELHWFAIWLVANDLGVSVEDLTKVTLIHDMAHFYTHVGRDARTNDALTRTCVMIVEGVAQYYTHELPLGLALARGHRVDADRDQRFVVRLAPATRIQQSRCDTLPNRRRRVAEFVNDGLSSAAIAKEHGITIAIVKTHLRKIFATLGMQRRVELALRTGRRR